MNDTEHGLSARYMVDILPTTPARVTVVPTSQGAAVEIATATDIVVVTVDRGILTVAQQAIKGLSPAIEPSIRRPRGRPRKQSFRRREPSPPNQENLA
jgi:hypothetical protein